LKFFERDPIEWEECELTGFYQSLIRMKKENVALWNGEFGGPMEKIKTSKERRIFAFSRVKDGNKVIVFLNLSRKNTTIKPELDDYNGDYQDYFTKERVALPLQDSLTLGPWEYKVLVH